MPKCINAHDLCYGGAGGPCPECELTDDEAFEKDYSRVCEVCGALDAAAIRAIKGPAE